MAGESLSTEVRWAQLEAKLQQHFGKKPDLIALLMLIGIQETGLHKSNFSKEEKQDLIHVGTCRVLSISGYFRKVYTDQEGWPHWEPAKELPALDVAGQEQLLREHILAYFDELGG